MAIPAALMSPDQRFHLVVSEKGILPIPEELRAAFRLEPGEPVALEPWPASLSLVPLRTFIDALDEATPIEQQWKLVHERFLNRTLIFMEERGLPIPENFFRLQPGESVHLQVLRSGNVPKLSLFPARGPAVPGTLAV